MPKVFLKFCLERRLKKSITESHIAEYMQFEGRPNSSKYGAYDEKITKVLMWWKEHEITGANLQISDF